MCHIRNEKPALCIPTAVCCSLLPLHLYVGTVVLPGSETSPTKSLGKTKKPDDTTLPCPHAAEPLPPSCRKHRNHEEENHPPSPSSPSSPRNHDPGFALLCSCLAVEQAEEEAEQLRGVQHTARLRSKMRACTSFIRIEGCCEKKKKESTHPCIHPYTRPRRKKKEFAAVSRTARAQNQTDSRHAKTLLVWFYTRMNEHRLFRDKNLTNEDTADNRRGARPQVVEMEHFSFETEELAGSILAPGWVPLSFWAGWVGGTVEVACRRRLFAIISDQMCYCSTAVKYASPSRMVCCCSPRTSIKSLASRQESGVGTPLLPSRVLTRTGPCCSSRDLSCGPNSLVSFL